MVRDQPPLFLAMSALQGRPMAQAFDTLAGLGPVGVQLTPGNLPTPSFAVHVARSGRTYRTHHGFSWTRRRQPVWDGLDCLVHSDSVHPPTAVDACWLETWADSEPTTALEVMYPGEGLGTGTMVQHAMDLGIPVAVDVSHLFIMECAGAIDTTTLAALWNYDHIAEVHVSDNDGRHDLHRPIHTGTYGLHWARERLTDGTPTVLEAYLHRLTPSQRARQLALLMD